MYTDQIYTHHYTKIISDFFFCRLKVSYVTELLELTISFTVNTDEMKCMDLLDQFRKFTFTGHISLAKISLASAKEHKPLNQLTTIAFLNIDAE